MSTETTKVPGNNLDRALHRLDKLYNRLTEDYQASWGQPVDYTDISNFPGDPQQETAVPSPQPALGISYPQAISILYINDMQRREIVADSRTMAQTNPFCIGAQRNRVAYTVGKGHTYKVSLIDPDAFGNPDEGKELLSSCRDIIDKFRDRNRWAARQKETVRRLDRDGEAFRRAFIDGGEGEVNVRFIEPLCIQDPGVRPEGSHIYFGIDFKAYDNGVDMETPVAFYVKDIRALSEQQGEPQRIDAKEIQHLKANVDLGSPRGLPTWYALRNHLTRAMKLLRNITTVAAVQASIAMIRKHIGATRNLVQQALDKEAPARGVDVSGRMENVRTFDPGSILEIPDVTDVQFPQAGIDVTRYVAGIQAELRAVGAALAMPEYMISGDSSNANYASTMVAEGPAVKTFEEMQADLIDADLVVIRLQLQVAATAGLLPDNVLELVKIEAEPPIIKSENRLQEAQADIALVNAGAMSKDTLAARHNLEYEDERNKIEADRDMGVGYGAQPQVGSGQTSVGSGNQDDLAQPAQQPPNPTQQGDMAAAGEVPKAAATEAPVVNEGDPVYWDGRQYVVKGRKHVTLLSADGGAASVLTLQEYNDLHHTDGTFTDPATHAHNTSVTATTSGKPEDHAKAAESHMRAAAKATADGDTPIAMMHQGYAAMHGAAAQGRIYTAVPSNDPPEVAVPDIVQRDHYSCGAAAAMACGTFYGVGPKTLEEWKAALGTTEAESTPPRNIVEYLQSLGLTVEARDNMTIDDLASYYHRGWPVIVPVQDYGPALPGRAKFAYGHYLTVTKVDSQYVLAQDSSEDNVTHGSGSIQADGRILIPRAKFDANWHDKDVDGNPYVRYGIAVGPPSGGQ